MNYQQLASVYLETHSNRQQAYFKLLSDNIGIDGDVTAERFLMAEFTQAKCPNFKVNP